MRQPTAFETLHADKILGTLEMPDRVIFRGHGDWSHARNLMVLLSRWSVLLKQFGRFAQRQTAIVTEHAKKTANDAGRPFIYLDAAHTARSGKSKEQIAREIAQRDGIREGLICVLRVVEPGGAFDVRGNRATHRLELVYRMRKCLHFYFYLMDREFGFMHVRLQSWLPFRIQVYVNGREWLCRRLDRRGIGYERYDNALVRIDDMAVAHKLAHQFMRRRWPHVLDRFARAVNPWLAHVRRAGFDGGYYWVTEQFELAADVMFPSRGALRALMPDLIRHSMTVLGAEDALRFLGRKPWGLFKSEATADLKRRPEGYRVKFRMKRNHIKLYDKASVLRIETTICNPYEFKVPRRDGDSRRPYWMPMTKGVANFWRYCQVGSAANGRYFEALSHARMTRAAVAEIDRVCRTRVVAQRHVARLNPVAAAEVTLFAAVLFGGHHVRGFRNADVAPVLYPSPAASDREARRRRERISRRLAKLRGHGLIAKVPRSRRYRVTSLGHRIMGAAVRFRLVDTEQAFGLAA